MLENEYKIVVPLFGAAYAAPNKGTTISYSFRSPKTVVNPPVHGKIQGLFKAFECFSSTFQDKFNFQGLFKANLCERWFIRNPANKGWIDGWVDRWMDKM